MGLGSTSWVLRQLGLTASGRHPTLEGFHLFEALWDRESGYHSLRPYDNWGNYAKQDRGCWGRVAFPSPGVHIVPVYYFVYTGVGTPLYHSGGWSWQMGRASNNHFGLGTLFIGSVRSEGRRRRQAMTSQNGHVLLLVPVSAMFCGAVHGSLGKSVLRTD